MTAPNATAPLPPIKLSSLEPKAFWEIPVFFEDEHLLALDKPAGLPVSLEPDDPSERPHLMRLLHDGIKDGKPWAQARGLTYLAPAHRLDAETSGVLLLAKNKAAQAALADAFGTEQPVRMYVALVQDTPEQDEFEVDASIAPHPTSPGLMRIDPQRGKKSKTQFKVLTKFRGYTLLQARLLTDRHHQIRVHLRHARLSVLGDPLYRGGKLLLSSIKRKFRERTDREERPLISTPALHSESLSLVHPVTKELITITAPWPKDMRVAVKYLKQFAGL